MEKDANFPEEQQLMGWQTLRRENVSGLVKPLTIRIELR
jgi:hypothetical protein